MIRRRLLLAVSALAASTAIAQPAPPHRPPDDRPPHGGGPGGPGMRGDGRDDRFFVQGQLLRALEAKTSLLIEQGKQEEAAKELQRILDIDVQKPGPLWEARIHLLSRLAITYTNVGKKKEAVETIKKVLADVPAGTPLEASVLVDAGTVYRQAGMLEEAMKAFDRAIEVSNKLATAPRGPARRPPPGGGPEGPPPPN